MRKTKVCVLMGGQSSEHEISLLSGRVDMILQSRTPVVLEINTIPGLTPVSILPKEAAAAGISYSRLLDRIINLALEDV